MAAAPNVTSESVPAHLVRQLLARYRKQLADHTMQGDQAAAADEEEDDFHFQTRQINIVAQNRELFSLLFMNQT